METTDAKTEQPTASENPTTEQKTEEPATTEETLSNTSEDNQTPKIEEAELTNNETKTL